LTVLVIPSFGQEIEKIIFESQQAEEPPIKQGCPKFTIEFNAKANGDFVASDFYKNKKKMKLKDKVTVEKERFEKIMEWKKLNKRTFSQSDLGLDITALKNQTNHYQLNFEIPPDLMVNVDSFQFCQTYKMTKSISTGGERLGVTLINNEGQKQEFIFDSNDIGEKNFNLTDYILCYSILAVKIPDEVKGYGLFSRNKFMDIILYYQKTVECEGFYYKEFTDKNPTMTSKDKRMMTGWNFIEYMEQRSKKSE